MNPPNGSSRASNPAPLLMAPATVALLQAHLPAGAGVQPEPRRHVSWAPLEGRRPPTRARWIPAGPEHSSSDDGCEADSTGCYMQSLDVDQLSRSSTILAPAVTRLAHHPASERSRYGAKSLRLYRNRSSTSVKFAHQFDVRQAVPPTPRHGRNLAAVLDTRLRLGCRATPWVRRSFSGVDALDRRLGVQAEAVPG